MTNQDQRGGVRHPQPAASVRDPGSATTPDPGHEDSEANRQDAARERAASPVQVSEETVAQIAEVAEERARR